MFKKGNTWFLPENVEEFIPPIAESVDRLRRKLLDLYYCHGYRLVMPPIIEYHDSLVSGSGIDLADITLNLYSEPDQPTLGIRSDFTSQVARIDSQSQVQGTTGRYCYFGETLLTRPRKVHGIRNPFQAGVELIGSASIAADKQMIDLMVASIRKVTDQTIHIKLGHIAIFTRLCQLAKIDEQQLILCEEIIKRRSFTDMEAFCKEHLDTGAVATALAKLPRMIGAMDIFERVQDYADLDTELASAIDDLYQMARSVQALDDKVEVVIDFADLRGYSYHNALLYSCYCNNALIAQGGRYDGIGNYFGKHRSATGFSLIVNSLINLATTADEQCVWLAYQYRESAIDWLKDYRLRGGRCLVALDAEEIRPSWCLLELRPYDGDWKIVSLSDR